MNETIESIFLCIIVVIRLFWAFESTFKCRVRLEIMLHSFMFSTMFAQAKIWQWHFGRKERRRETFDKRLSHLFFLSLRKFFLASPCLLYCQTGKPV